MSRFWRQIIWVVPLALALTNCNRVDFSGDRREAVEDHLARAKKRYEQRDFQGAIAAYEEILRVNPQHSSAHFQIALIYDRNLNDYLNAAYHYQRFLKSPNPEAVKVELARGFLENTKLQFAAGVPNASGQNSPELVKLRTENAALHRQVEELKREIVRGRSRSVESTRTPDSKPAPPSISAPIPDTKTAARPRTYKVKKGEGIQAIAEKVYGDRRKWRDILTANPAIKDPDRLVPGQVLNLP
ncbi:MAG: LysM peptidoglycan-binding domain-containing protein [Verrucomicrobia bacterium]|nr:LysM peptidoglycan-binding domain-containing protein [Verrucomicrobiota bacterium]